MTTNFKPKEMQMNEVVFQFPRRITVNGEEYEDYGKQDNEMFKIKHMESTFVYFVRKEAYLKGVDSSFEKRVNVNGIDYELENVVDGTIYLKSLLNQKVRTLGEKEF